MITIDEDSAAWVRDLSSTGPEREAAAARLHALLLRVTRSEGARRRASLPQRVRDDLDTLCVQAAGDALMAVLRKLADFRGVSRFTTWASKFAIFEVSTLLRRQAFRHRQISPAEDFLAAMPDPRRPALSAIQDRELLAAIDRAMHDQLTERQRRVLQAAVIDDISIDVLAEQMATSRGAIYKSLHDARARLREALVQAGHEEARP